MEAKPTDLVLQLTGPKTETFRVSTPKCQLAARQSASDASFCSIYRGPGGTALQSYDSDVLVNGESASAQWLSVGDEITFPNQSRVRVEQLGDWTTSIVPADVTPIMDAPVTETPFVPAMTMSPVAPASAAPAFAMPTETEEESFLPVAIETEPEAAAELTAADIVPAATERAAQTPASPTNDVAPTDDFSPVADLEAAEELAPANEAAPVGEFTDTTQQEIPVNVMAGLDSSTADAEESFIPVMEELPTLAADPVAAEPFTHAPAHDPVEPVAEEVEPVAEEVEPVAEVIEPIAEVVEPKTETPAPASEDDDAARNMASELEDIFSRLGVLAEPTDSPMESPAPINPQPLNSDDRPGDAPVEQSPAASEMPFSLADTTTDATPIDRVEETFLPTADDAPVESQIESAQTIVMPEVSGVVDESPEFGTDAMSVPTAIESFIEQPVAAEALSPVETSVEQPENGTTSESEPDGEHLDALAALRRAFADSTELPEPTEVVAPTEVVTPAESVAPAPVSAAESVETSEPAPVVAGLAEDAFVTLDEYNEAGEETGFAEDSAGDLQVVAIEPDDQIETAQPADDDQPTSSILEQLKPETVEPTPPRRKPEPSESLSEVLARMKASGNDAVSAWSDEESDEAPKPAMEQPAAPELDAVPEPQPVEPPVAADMSDSVTDGTVDDYMSQLLSRMRGEASSEPESVAKAAPVSKPAKVDPILKKKVNDVVHAPVELLKAEDYLPKTKADQPRSFDSMRQIANMTARQAVKRSNMSQLKDSLVVKSGAAGASLILAAAFLYLGEVSATLCCVAAGVSAGGLLFIDYKRLDKEPRVKVQTREKPAE